MSAWPKAKLGDLLVATDRGEAVDAAKEYRLLGVRLDGYGPFLRETVLGAQTAATRLFRVVAGDFIYSRLFACRGAFGVIEPELDGCFVSGEFPTFNVIPGKLDVGFLKYWFRLPNVISLVDKDCTGSTPLTRNRFKEQFFLALEIPLPSLAEQRQIVARIEELALKIREVHTLRQAEETEMRHMLLGAFRRITDGAPQRQMREVAPLVRRPVATVATDIYPEVGIRSFGKGTFHKPALSGLELGSKRVFRIHAGDLLFSNVFAWEGAIAVAKQEDSNRVGSHRYISCVPNQDVATAQFLCFYFHTKEGLGKIQEGSPGGAGRNRTLGLAALDSIEVPVPSISSQQWFDELQSQVSALRRLHAETVAELDALLPAILDRAFKGELLPRELAGIALASSFATEAPAMRYSRRFIRAVFASEIISRLHGERTFGQVKFQKALFLGEYAAQVLEIESHPQRFQNGPHDPELIREVEEEMRSRDWFESHQRPDGAPGHAYRALADAGKHTSYFEQFWPEKAPVIRRVIDTLLKWDTERCERLATAYAAWNDLLIWSRPVTDAAILTEILERWHPAKLKIPKAKWQETLGWMRENDFVPMGFGRPTALAPQAELF